jgi:uncharacterized protein YceK
MRKIALVAVVLALLVTGCSTTRITNLTTTRQPRSTTGMYPVEFQWDTSQQSVIDATIKPFVIVGSDSYPMRPSLGIDSRWETVIPVPASQQSVNYYFKVDYIYREFGGPARSSKLSSEYRLLIIDK